MYIKSTLPRLRQRHGKRGGEKGGEIWNSDFQERLSCCTLELTASGLPAQDLDKIGPINTLSWKDMERDGTHEVPSLPEDV